MIVFGFGKRTGKDLGPGAAYVCPRCHNNIRFKLVDQRTWFTLFFIPIIPCSHQYLEICPICGFGRQMSKSDFEQALKSSQDDHDYLTK